MNFVHNILTFQIFQTDFCFPRSGSKNWNFTPTYLYICTVYKKEASYFVTELVATGSDWAE